MFKKCKRGHPIDNDGPCQMCLQEDYEQEKRDDALMESIKRLISSGKFRLSAFARPEPQD